MAATEVKRLLDGEIAVPELWPSFPPQSITRVAAG